MSPLELPVDENALKKVLEDAWGKLCFRCRSEKIASSVWKETNKATIIDFCAGNSAHFEWHS